MNAGMVGVYIRRRKSYPRGQCVESKGHYAGPRSVRDFRTGQVRKSGEICSFETIGESRLVDLVRSIFELHALPDYQW